MRRDIPMPKFERKGEVIWDIPTSYKKGMRVPARIYSSEKLLKQMDMNVFDQLTNVATLPGIQTHAMCMPDAHSGYGFPIGGVAAFDLEDGIISPGGIGFDKEFLEPVSSVRLASQIDVVVLVHVKEIMAQAFDDRPFATTIYSF